MWNIKFDIVTTNTEHPLDLDLIEKIIKNTTKQIMLVTNGTYLMQHRLNYGIMHLKYVTFVRFDKSVKLEHLFNIQKYSDRNANEYATN